MTLSIYLDRKTGVFSTERKKNTVLISCSISENNGGHLPMVSIMCYEKLTSEDENTARDFARETVKDITEFQA